MGKALSNLKKQKGRFVGIPHVVVGSDPYVNLSAPEVRLLWDLMYQYNGVNNGMLSPCLALMEKRGWAKTSLNRAFNGLQHSGFVVVTRQGWKKRGKPTLVAVTFKGIDTPYEDKGIEYDSGIVPTKMPLNYWCKIKSCWKHQPSVKDHKKKLPPKLEEQNTSYFPNVVQIKQSKLG